MQVRQLFASSLLPPLPQQLSTRREVPRSVQRWERELAGGVAGQEGLVARKDDEEWFLGAQGLVGETKLNNDKFKSDFQIKRCHRPSRDQFPSCLVSGSGTGGGRAEQICLRSSLG